MTEFSEEEKEFLESLEECRISTVHGCIPHVKPASYIFDYNAVLIATDYDTRTYKNVKQNPKVAIAIDIYKPGAHKAVCIQGTVEIIENGQEFKRIYNIFHDRFEWVRRDPWGESEAPFLKITAFTKTSWGLSQ